jgi:hypothetical protein
VLSTGAGDTLKALLALADRGPEEPIRFSDRRRVFAEPEST